MESFAGGPPLVLVNRDSPRRWIFEYSDSLIQNAARSMPLMLKNSEYGVVWKTSSHEQHVPWSIKRLEIGHKTKVISVHFENQWLVKSDDNDILDVDGWNFSDQQGLNMLHGDTDEETFRHEDMRGRKFMINRDGTISPTARDLLCLGIGYPRLVLVEKNSPCALFFANSPQGIFSLELSGSWIGFGLFDIFEGYRHFEESQWCIGKAEDAIRVRFDEQLMRTEGDGFVLNVAFLKSGNEVNWFRGPTPRHRPHGGSHDWIPDTHAAHGLPYMISCGGNKNFVLGSNCDPTIYSQIATPNLTAQPVELNHSPTDRPQPSMPGPPISAPEVTQKIIEVELTTLRGVQNINARQEMTLKELWVIARRHMLVGERDIVATLMEVQGVPNSDPNLSAMAQNVQESMLYAKIDTQFGEMKLNFSSNATLADLIEEVADYMLGSKKYPVRLWTEDDLPPTPPSPQVQYFCAKCQISMPMSSKEDHEMAHQIAEDVKPAPPMPDNPRPPPPLRPESPLQPEFGFPPLRTKVSSIDEETKQAIAQSFLDSSQPYDISEGIHAVPVIKLESYTLKSPLNEN